MIKIYLSRILGERRITQRKLASDSQIRPATINAIYNETIQRLDIDVLNRICKALEIQPGDLIEYIPDDEGEK